MRNLDDLDLEKTIELTAEEIRELEKLEMASDQAELSSVGARVNAPCADADGGPSSQRSPAAGAGPSRRKA